MNRDIPLLESILPLMQEVRALEARRDFERGRMVNITAHLSFTGGHSSIPSGSERVFAELAELEEAHEDKLRMYIREVRRAEAVIGAVQDAFLRAFITLVYVERQPPAKVREALALSEWQYRRARESVENAQSMERVRIMGREEKLEQASNP